MAQASPSPQSSQAHAAVAALREQSQVSAAAQLLSLLNAAALTPGETEADLGAEGGGGQPVGHRLDGFRLLVAVRLARP